MKIAIFHDYFGSIGGGEKLVLDLAHGLNADVYTTEINRKNLKRINKHHVRVILLKDSIKFPVLKQIHSSIIFHNANLNNKGYDFYIMSGNWAIFACKKHHSNINFIHTPPRMFYDDNKSFYKQVPWYGKILFLIWVTIHKRIYEKQIKYMDSIIANSNNTQHRIKKYYHKDSVVISPPIKKYAFRKYGDYWLSINRIYPHKRIELQIEAFRKLPHERLIIVGGYMSGDHAKAYANKVFTNLPKNVSYIGEIDERIVEKLYGECKAFITTSKDEDFGMTVLEAMSAGKPVIAPNEGGYRETVINGKTGYLVKANSTEIIKNIKKISVNPSKYKSACIIQADKYNISRFIKKIKQELTYKR
jgi:glycosyltransferase involved in cell wall biosynthesis